MENTLEGWGNIINPPTPKINLSEEWIINVDKNGIPQGLDNSSGGYPYKAPSIQQIKIWSKLEEAQKYAKMFKFITKKVRVELIYK